MADLPLLSVEGVTKRFSFNGQPITALEGAELAIRKGEFICLIGPSGCGKSTLLRMAGGFETPTEGTLRMWAPPSRRRGRTAAWCSRITGCSPG